MSPADPLPDITAKVRAQASSHQEAKAKAMNATILRSVPRSVSGQPTRLAEIYDTAWSGDEAAFAACYESNGWLRWERSLHVGELERIQRAIEEGAQVQAPAGIPGFDRVHVGGCRLACLAKASGLLSEVRYKWRAPATIGKDEYGDAIRSAGLWMQEITVTQLRLGISRAQWQTLKRQFFKPVPAAA